jgi:hypothetical protein
MGEAQCTKCKAVTAGNLPPLVVPLCSNLPSLCHSVFRQRHYPSHLSSPSLPVLSYTDKEVCAISRNWFLFCFSVVNLVFFLCRTLWHLVTSVFTTSPFDLLVTTQFFCLCLLFIRSAFLWSSRSFVQLLFILHTRVSSSFCCTLLCPLLR